MRRSRPVLVLFAVAMLVVAVVGCGGGGSGSSGDEAAARKKLEAGAEKISQARSARTRVLFEVEEEGEPEEVGCLSLAVEDGKPERFDMTYYDLNCSGGTEAREMVAIGRRAWASNSSEGGGWSAARIAPSLIRDLDSEQTDLGRLFDAAEHIEAVPDGAAVEEGNDNFVEVPKYFFEAPASAFPDSSDELGDAKVEFEAVLDRHGYLRELVVHGDEDETGATVTDTYEDIDENLAIEPPAGDEVHGPVTTIHSRKDLDALIGLGSS